MSDPFDPKSYTVQLRENWNAAAAHYQRLSADHFPPLSRSFIEFAGLAPGHSVLDVACGPGTATAEALRAVGVSGKVVGVDLSAHMLKLAGERLGAVDLREMDAEALDFPDQTFDSVICQLGLMLFARPQVALREMARVTKKGGRVSCLVQGAPDKMLFTALIMKTMIKHAPELKTEGGPSLYAFGQQGALEKALAQEGLTNIRTKPHAGVFCFTSPEDYWESMTSGAGRTGSMLKSLPAQKRSIIQEDVLRQAQSFRKRNHIEIPYEVVMASAIR